MFNESELFQILYDQTDFSEIAEIASEFRLYHPEDEREFYFSSTRYGEKLLVVPQPKETPSDFLQIPLTWVKWREDVYYTFDAWLEDFLEISSRNFNLHEFISYCVKEWLSSRVFPLLEKYGFQVS